MHKKQISAPDRLTDTLRYLYDALRYLEVRLLAIRFEFDNQVWVADTPEEAIALREKLEQAVHGPNDPFKEMDRLADYWTIDRFMDVINGIGVQQHRMLGVLYYRPGITSDELRQILKLESEVALAGVISGLSKQLRLAGIEPRKVFQIDVKWSGKKKTRKFILDDFFKGAGAQLNWPEAWVSKESGIGKQDEHSAKVVNAGNESA
jgi:hypothetical protein